MNITEQMALAKRNTVEIVTESELKDILSKKKHPVCYCGYETSGAVHLGHAVTITKLMDLEKAGFKVKVLFADWHTWLNRKGDWDFIHKTTKIWERSFKSMGLKNAEFVLGSTFQRKMSYVDDLLSMSLDTTINRALRSMQGIARDIEHAHVSQVIYPFMQIEDIKALKVDVAVGGIEQRKIHMLGRELTPVLNYGPFACIHTPLIPSLQGPSGKMSSSKPETMISVADSDEEIKKKIKKSYCPEGIVQDNPVLSIAKLLVFPRIDVLEIKRPEKFGGTVQFENYDSLESAFVDKKLHPLDLKNKIADEVSDIFEPVRRHFKK
ncbi:MAG: tyrosine--tRNA ligase [Candidatus Aenigmarchaeota archaeon]|nr:tyrosine--tRNA ligase [Candidatus Aenigmarchaeota archaeon]